MFNPKDFPNGISYFTFGNVVLCTSWPEDKVCCQYCKYCRSEKELNRFWCRLTEEMIYNPAAGVGFQCPVVIEESNNEWSAIDG